MKMTAKMIAITTAIIAIASFAACKSSPSEKQGTAASARISAQAEQAADDFRIVDWKDRSIGEIASPTWLYPAVRGNWNRFKDEWSVGQERLTDFWQLIETTGADGKKTRVYSYWVVYACDSAVRKRFSEQSLLRASGRFKSR